MNMHVMGRKVAVVNRIRLFQVFCNQTCSPCNGFLGLFAPWGRNMYYMFYNLSSSITQ